MNIQTPVLPSPTKAQASESLRLLRDKIYTAGIQDANICVIDDDDLITQIIRLDLRESGFQKVVTFNDPLKAMEHIAKRGADVILLDLNMPNVSGQKILRFLRKHEVTQYLPVIIMTSTKDEATKLAALEDGANEFLTKPVNAVELVQRLCNTLKFQKHTGDISKHVRHVERELRTDGMTDLCNRRAFDEKFDTVFQESEFYQFSLILIDIDNFKEINDQFGHEVGDNVLSYFAGVVKYKCGSGDIPFRLGGDEFAILSLHQDPDYPYEVAQAIKNKVDLVLTNSSGQEHRLTASIGIATYSEQMHKKSDLFNAADAALYQSKHQGRNAINFYTDSAMLSIGELQFSRASKQPAESTKEDIRDGLILVIDDEPLITDLLKLDLNNFGYNNIVVENDGRLATKVVQSKRPDLVILDIRMPGVNGIDILDEIKKSDLTHHIPVLIMTSSTEEEIMIESLRRQASDFLTKPAKPAELDARVLNSLKLKKQHDQLVQLSRKLSREVDVRTAELFSTRRETILCLARAAESRDKETGNHVIRVGRYAALIAKQLGMTEDFVGWIELAAQLHDVGKLSIPDAILQKPGKLTAEERKVIETHCDNAEKIFFGNSSEESDATITSPLLKMAARIASSHHEKWDGSGYPRGLSGDEIPIEGRITAVADVFDALSSKRVYKQAIEVDECIQMIQDDRGTHFDPNVVDAFVASKSKIEDTMMRWKDRFAELHDDC